MSMAAPTYKTIDELASIFFQKGLVRVGDANTLQTPVTTTAPSDLLPPAKRRKPSTQAPSTPQQPTSQVPALTPISSSIVENVSPETRERLIKLFALDDAICSQYEALDLDYQEKFENGRLGFVVEDWLAANGVCPVCGNHTLCKYQQSNIPVVDLVCTNVNYHLKHKLCFLFQVKTSLNDTYFNLRQRSVSVGSRVYGHTAHTVTGSAPLASKYIVPGYICIKLRPKSLEHQTYSIDSRRSFVLIPNYSSTNPQPYYGYTSTNGCWYGHPTIDWNPLMVTVYPISSVIGSQKVVEYVVYPEVSIANPYRQFS